MGLVRSRRLKKARAFVGVREKGRAVAGRYFVLGCASIGSEVRLLAPSEGREFGSSRLDWSRYGIVTSRRLGGAVVRNSLRRRVREIIRPLLVHLNEGYWLVTVVRHTARRATFAALREDWIHLARRHAVFLKSAPRELFIRQSNSDVNHVDRQHASKPLSGDTP